MAVSNIVHRIAGLSVPSSGTNSLTIGGTPTATGTENFTVTATDAAGGTTTTHYSLTVYPDVALNPTTLSAGEVGVSYNHTITSSGGSGGIALALSGVTNTTGLNLTGTGTGTITISGTPTSSGTVSFTVTPTDSLGTETGTHYSFSVIASVALNPTSLPTGEVGVNYSHSITAGGGSGSITLDLSGVTNTTGLGITGTGTGTITVSGTPTSSGTVSFTVTPTDGIGTGQGRAYSFTVMAGVTLNPTSLPGGSFGQSYSQTITAGGGSGTIALHVGNITNTTGLNIPTSGTGSITISGTPTAAGTVTFTVTPTDAIGTGPGKLYSFVVASMSLSPVSLPADTIGNAYNQTITAQGTGNTTLVVSNIQDAIAGLALPTSGTNALHITGTPTATGTETFSVIAITQSSGTTRLSYSITVNGALTFTPKTLPVDTLNTLYNQTITVGGGTGNKNLVVNITQAIAGLVVPTSGTNTLFITGTPTATGTETFTVTATDQSGAATTASYSITVQGLKITQSMMTPAVINPGSYLTYAITLSNLGTQAVSGVQIIDQLPGSTSFYGALPYSSTLRGSTLTINVGTLAAGQTVMLSVVVRVNPNTPSGTSFLNQISVEDALAGSLTMANNTNTVTAS